jgi:homogentisate 1,2-dioxygenase
MLDRVCLGTVARKHHVVLRDESGKLLYEHCVTRRGFDGAYTILYERALPPRDLMHRHADVPADPEPYFDEGLHRRHLHAGKIEQRGDHLQSRITLLSNSDVAIGVCRPTDKVPRYFSNGDGDELYYVQSGTGVVESMYGPLPYRPGDYLLIPRSTVYRVVPDASTEGETPLWLFIEGRKYVEIPPNFRNPFGQLRMDAPYCHRDFRRPERLPSPSGPDFHPGRYPIIIKRGGAYHEIVRDTDPMDIAGWDGFVYPIALSIHDYQAKVGRVHLPPTVFSTFAGGGFLVCSFVPRLVDWGENAIPCPYPHSNPDCDEVIFYSSGNFTSRRGIGPGSISHHPGGLPHGPQPGAYEGSIGKTHTDELAVMIDTFQPLGLTAEARALEDPAYHDSWRR